MSRTRNATEFRTAILGAEHNYSRIFQPLLDNARAQLAATDPDPGPDPDFDESLECHARAYLLNAFLAALNWRLDARPQDGLPNLLPEAAVRSAASGTRRFLDYLGFERATGRPLLVVEAKRRNVALPLLATLPRNSRASASKLVDQTLSDSAVVVARGLSGERLTGDWSTWLMELRDYIRSISAQAGFVPRRVIMANGHWLVLFLDPIQAFLGANDCRPESVRVFRNPAEIAQRAEEIFAALEHQMVLGEVPVLAPIELPFHINSGSDVRQAMHALRLRYNHTPGIYHPAPVIHVAPAIILQSKQGAWLRVENPGQQYELPYEPERLDSHLGDVRAAAETLLAQIRNQLNTDVPLTTLQEHFGDDASFDVQKAVVRLPQDEYFILTGEHTHYLLPQPTVEDCPYHDWGQSHRDGVAAPPASIVVPSVEERSFFRSGQSHHCAHRDVRLAKSSQITAENQLRCGSRSGRPGAAFCEIWSFERRLCCRTCAFQNVCTKAEIFHLPCVPLVQVQPSIS